MVELEEERILEMQTILEKERNAPVTREQAIETLHAVRTLAEIIVPIAIEARRREKMLKEFPGGYHLDAQGACQICEDVISGKQSWFDKYGLKCIHCQRAIDKRAIPPSMAVKTEGWYSAREFEYHFNIKKPQLRRLIKAGILKDRIISNESGKVHLQVFLIKENKSFLPPKRLLEGTVSTEIIDGQAWTVFNCWHRVVNPVQHLRKYGVSGYLDFDQVE